MRCPSPDSDSTLLSIGNLLRPSTDDRALCQRALPTQRAEKKFIDLMGSFLPRKYRRLTAECHKCANNSWRGIFAAVASFVARQVTRDEGGSGCHAAQRCSFALPVGLWRPRRNKIAGTQRCRRARSGYTVRRRRRECFWCCGGIAEYCNDGPRHWLERKARLLGLRSRSLDRQFGSSERAARASSGWGDERAVLVGARGRARRS